MGDEGAGGGGRRACVPAHGTFDPLPWALVPRKTSTPGDRKGTDSNSSTDRTPLSARTRTPSGSGPRGSLQRSGSNMGQRATAYSADGSKFGSSSALRNAVNNTRDYQ